MRISALADLAFEVFGDLAELLSQSAERGALRLIGGKLADQLTIGSVHEKLLYIGLSSLASQVAGQLLSAAPLAEHNTGT
jgi:hypothetical protein